jgi:hypothetical protein
LELPQAEFFSVLSFYWGFVVVVVVDVVEERHLLDQVHQTLHHKVAPLASIDMAVSSDLPIQIKRYFQHRHKDTPTTHLQICICEIQLLKIQGFTRMLQITKVRKNVWDGAEVTNALFFYTTF